LIVEIGTGDGLGTLSFLEGCSTSSVVTYDLASLSLFTDAVLDESIGGWEQRIGDLSNADFFAHESAILEEAEIILLDGPKFGRFERLLLPKLLGLSTGNRHFLLIDDIRLLNMTRLWAEIQGDKYDISSFGHFSGTGLVAL
jgi:hypothetical protein